MSTLNSRELRLKIELLEKLISKDELKRISVTKRLKRIRKQMNLLVKPQDKGFYE